MNIRQTKVGKDEGLGWLPGRAARKRCQGAQLPTSFQPVAERGARWASPLSWQRAHFPPAVTLSVDQAIQFDPRRTTRVPLSPVV